ncbi:uncharacterized protein [Eurosta solidaginis]|uniref:uncharacterized protein n=1 Tax=Eurosta solidaginis TaxID=178769 RepID=UPI003530751E
MVKTIETSEEGVKVTAKDNQNQNKNGNMVKEWTVRVKINNIDVQCVIDTGAQTNILSYKMAAELNINRFIKHSNSRLLTFSDTVTYGTKPASFLPIRSMQQLARDEARIYPLGAETIQNGFYVDDMIAGANSVDVAKELLNQTRKLLSLGNYHLRKWCSNNNLILADDRQEFITFDDGTSITKTLGLVWDPNLDFFIFSFSPFATPSKVTKRTILSAVARLYDPLGLIGPVVAKAKIFLQNLWKEKLH